MADDQDACEERGGSGDTATSSFSASGGCRLLDRPDSIHQIMGEGKANYASYRYSQLQVIPEPAFSEEMENSIAASRRVKINYMLLLAYYITLGKDFRLFFKAISKHYKLVDDKVMGRIPRGV